MAAEPSDIKPWTIRGVPPEERNAAIAAADRSDINIGDWLRRAIRTQIQQDNQASRAPVVVGPAMSDSQTDVERITDALAKLATAGVPISKRAANRLCAALVAPLPAGRTFGARKSDKTPEMSDGPD